MNDQVSNKSSNPQKAAYLIINAQIFPLTKPVTSIGRRLDNDLVIQDILISRQHAEISLKDDGFYIRDLNSTGGTFVNNKRISESILSSNDQILIANTPIMFFEQIHSLEDQLVKPTGTLNDEESDSSSEEYSSEI